MSMATSTLGEPVAIAFRAAPCRCVSRHHPQPRYNHMHHIIPLSWGGSDGPENLAALCPTSHENLHMTLRAWIKAGRPTKTKLTPFVLDLAMRAWDGRARQEAATR